MTNALRPDYALFMSPRVVRDVAAIEVEIDPHGAGQSLLGSGRADQGGGPLRGGLSLANRFAARIADPEVPGTITVVVAAIDGWLAFESVTVAGSEKEPAVSGAVVRSLALSLYLLRIREELGEAGGGGLLVKPSGSGEGWQSFELPVLGDEIDRFDFAQIRRAVNASKLTPEMAAAAYKQALASPDPEQNRRPTAAAADRLGASRGHVSRLLTQARRDGIAGLGPERPSRKKGSE